MEADKQFWCAWIEDASVLAVWDVIVEDILMPAWTIVTMLDSNEKVASLTAVKELLTADQSRVVSLGDAVLFDGDAFARLRAHSDNFFTGYDELWMTREVCASVEKPPGLRISAEQALTEAPMPGLGRWMEANGLCVGMGDGFGTNVATRDRVVARVLTRAYDGKIHVADAGASW